jgi:plastocyanin
MRRYTLIPGLVVVLVGLLALPVVVAAQPPLSATVEFGRPDTGSPFSPGHDESGHAKDRPVPRTVVISQGGTVTFRINARTHELAIYAAGTEPEDIDTSLTKPPDLVAGCPDVRLIDDPNGRIAVFDQPCAVGLQTDVVSFTFDEPGRYLFICNFLPHFVDFDMFGWVIVEPGE